MCWNKMMETTKSDEGSKVTKTIIEDIGMLQPEYHKPLQVPP